MNDIENLIEKQLSAVFSASKFPVPVSTDHIERVKAELDEADILAGNITTDWLMRDDGDFVKWCVSLSTSIKKHGFDIKRDAKTISFAAKEQKEKYMQRIA